MPEPRNEHSDAQHTARSAVWQTLTMLGQGLIPLQRILVSRLFGQALYGSYRIANDLVETLARAGMVASDKGLLRFLAMDRVAGDRDLEARSAGTALRLAAGGGILLSLALAALGPTLARVWWTAELGAMLPIMAPAVGAMALGVVLVAATLAARNTRVNLIVRGIGEPALLLALTLAAAAVTRGPGGIAFAHAGAYVALLVVAALATAALFGGRWLWTALRAPARPDFFRYVWPLALAEISNVLVQRAHVFLLSALADPRAVALVAAGEELGRPVAAVRYVFDPIATVAVAECFRMGDRVRLRYNLELITRWVASAAAPIAATVIVLRHELLALYGPDFGAGAGPMILLVGVHLANSVLGVGAGVIALAGRTMRFFVHNLIAAVLNVALCLLLIPGWGPMGAAVASFAGALALLAMLIVEAVRLEHVHPFRPALAKPFLAAALAGVAETAVNHAPLPLPVRVAAVVAAGAAVYAPALLALGTGEEERRLILRVLAAVGIRRGR